MSDVHTLADQVRLKCGTKTPDGGLTPRYSLNSPSDGQVTPPARSSLLYRTSITAIHYFIWPLLAGCGINTEHRAQVDWILLGSGESNKG